MKFLIFFFSLSAAAAVTPEIWLRCVAKTPQGEGVLLMDSTGKATLEVGLTGEKKSVCPLKTRQMEDRRNAVVSDLSFEFENSRRCQPLLSKASRWKLTEKVLLILSETHKGYKPHFQWLRTDQPGPCQLEKIEEGKLTKAVTQFEAKMYKKK